MALSNALDRLPTPRKTRKERLLEALAMYDEGLALQRLVFRRRHPELTDAEIDGLMQRWLAREDETR